MGVGGRGNIPRGERAVRIVIVVHRQADLLQVVEARRAAGRLAGLLHGGQKQGNQNADDGNYHQQLDEGETFAEGHDPYSLSI